MERCPECDAPLVKDAPLGLCAACLLRQGSGKESEETVVDEPKSGVPPEPAPRANFEETERIIGRYKLLQKIGEGGFGVVYMADQQEPIQRRVALKIIKQGMDTKQVVARFDVERQALAMMDHPNIAKVFDAGSTDSGRPYFVMELVRGIPLTQFCDERKLSSFERLELFRDVCNAVQHAHQKGIIHRDLKPSNILVGLDGDKAIVKVIDFGIAKAVNQQLTDKTLFTRFEQFVGTPIYISPEQAQLSAVDVDTRSDVYSLGVILYELLTGKPPLDPKKLLSAGFDEMRRMIRETEAPKPSTRIASFEGAELQEIAGCRQVEPRKLGMFLQGDLDWIVLKAIEKERGRRYDTVDALRHDIGRFLANETVSATPPSARYRAEKFIRRHRIGVTMTAVLAVVLLAAVVVSLSFAFRAREAEEVASRMAGMAEQARKRAVLNEREAQREAERSRRVVDQVRTMFFDSSRLENSLVKTPLGGRPLRAGTDPKMSEWLAETNEGSYWIPLREEPEARASLQLIMALANTRVGNNEGAVDLARQALTTLLSHRGGEDEEILSAREHLAYCLESSQNYGTSEQREAETLRAELLRTRQQSLGPESAVTQLALWEFINHHVVRGKNPLEEEALQGEALSALLDDGDATYDAVLGAGQRAPVLRRIYGLYQLAFFLEGPERAQAITVYEKLMDCIEEVPTERYGDFADYPRATTDIFAMQRVVAEAHLRLGNRARALELYEGLLDRLRVQYGPSHERLIGAAMKLIVILRRENDFVRAGAITVTMLEGWRPGGLSAQAHGTALQVFAASVAKGAKQHGHPKEAAKIIQSLEKLEQRLLQQ